MRLLSIFVIGLLLAGGPILGLCAEGTPQNLEAPAGAKATVKESEEHGIPARAVELPEIGRPFGFPITNSMLVTWVVAIGLIVFAQFATRRMKEIPEGPQN